MEGIRIRRFNTSLLEMQPAVPKKKRMNERWELIALDVYVDGGRGSTIGFYLQALEFSACMGISVEIKLQYCFSKEASLCNNLKKM